MGASYRIEMQPPEGDVFYLRGEFREVEAPSRLAYTFVWEDPDPDDQETLVTLTLEDLGDSTRLALDQGPFATEDRLALHRGGWSDGFEKIESLALPSRLSPTISWLRRPAAACRRPWARRAARTSAA